MINFDVIITEQEGSLATAYEAPTAGLNLPKKSEFWGNVASFASLMDTVRKNMGIFGLRGTIDTLKGGKQLADFTKALATSLGGEIKRQSQIKSSDPMVQQYEQGMSLKQSDIYKLVNDKIKAEGPDAKKKLLNAYNFFKATNRVLANNLNNINQINKEPQTIGLGTTGTVNKYSGDNTEIDLTGLNFMIERIVKK